MYYSFSYNFYFCIFINQLNSIKKRIKSISFGIKNNNKINEANQKIKLAIKKKDRLGKTNKLNSKLNSNVKINKKSSDSIILYSNSQVINNNKMKYNNDELNELSYNYAIIYDKRTFCQFYSSLLKAKHNFIFTFFNKEDYNPSIIKIDLFFVGLTMD